MSIVDIVRSNPNLFLPIEPQHDDLFPEPAAQEIAEAYDIRIGAIEQTIHRYLHSTDALITGADVSRMISDYNALFAAILQRRELTISHPQMWADDLNAVLASI